MRQKLFPLCLATSDLRLLPTKTLLSRVCVRTCVWQSNVDIVAYLQARIIPKLLNNFTVISGNKNIAKHACWHARANIQG